MPRYPTSFPMASAIKGVKCHATRPASPWPRRLRGLNATLSDQLPHGPAIKGVKCHATRPASPWPRRLRGLNATLRDLLPHSLGD
nr:hypothetical protein [Escherichia coli]